MAYSIRAFCSAVLQDPAARFSPSSNGQGPSPAPAEGHLWRIPAPIMATGLVLILVAAAILVQALSLHLSPAPVVVNTSAPLSPVLIRESSVPPAVPISVSDQGMIPDKTTTSSPGAPVATPSGRSSQKIPVINAASLETRIHELVNRVRQEHGLSALGTDTILTSLARSHSTDMAARGYFGHVNLDERDATARGAAAGFSCHKAADPYYAYAIAENLYATYRSRQVLRLEGRVSGYAWTNEEAMAEETVEAWMNSPDHRDNILDKGMGREGIGVAFGQGDMVFVTQDFC